VWLLPARIGQPDDEFELPRSTDSPVVFLNESLLSRLGAAPVERFTAGSLFLGAVSSPAHRKDGVKRWFYVPEWVFVDLKSARQSMEAVLKRGRSVRVFHVPVLAAYLPDVVVLVAELNTEKPFRQAHTRIMLIREGQTSVGERGERLFREDRFLPRTLQDLVGFLMAGVPEKGRENWLFAAKPSEAWEPRGLAPVYTVSRRESRRIGTENKGASWVAALLRQSSSSLENLLAKS
jgi:hypothetical protein